MVFQIELHLFLISSESYLSVSSCTIVFQIELHLFLISSESNSSKGIGLLRMFKEILHSSSTCSLDFESSLRASIAGAEDFPPFSFCAAIISCLLISASSILFFFSSASAAFFSASSFLIFSSSSLFFIARAFSCSALISFLLACLSLSLLSSASSLVLSSLHWLI